MNIRADSSSEWRSSSPRAVPTCRTTSWRTLSPSHTVARSGSGSGRPGFSCERTHRVLSTDRSSCQGNADSKQSRPLLETANAGIRRSTSFGNRRRVMGMNPRGNAPLRHHDRVRPSRTKRGVPVALAGICASAHVHVCDPRIFLPESPTGYMFRSESGHEDRPEFPSMLGRAPSGGKHAFGKGHRTCLAFISPLRSRARGG